MNLAIEYIGHSAFYINTGEKGILIDPFISGNPNAKFDFNKVVSDIILTHAHADHLGDAIPIAIRKNALITCIFELANYCMSKGVKANAINFGGKINFDWGSLRFLPAFHSSSAPSGEYMGMPASVLIEINGIKIYHAGDTCLNSEMKMIGELYSPDVALLPIGGQFTMDVDDAVVATKLLNAKKVIPMHYNTFSAIQADVDDFRLKIEALGKECYILKSGEKIDL